MAVLPIAVKHVKVSDKADGQDPSLLQPSDWNKDHVFKVEAKKLVGNSTASEGVAENISVSEEFTLEDGLLSLASDDEGGGPIVRADQLIDTPTVAWTKTVTEIKANVPDNAITLAKLEDGTQGDILYYGASGAPTRLVAGSAGMFLKSGTAAVVGPPAVAATDPSWGYSGAPHAVLRDEKPSNTDGGTFTAAGWRDRVINTEMYDTYNFVALASNIFTLPIGTWIIEWSCPGRACERHQTRLLNVGNSTSVYGTSEYAPEASNAQTRSTGIAQVIHTVATGYKIQHYSTQDGFFGEATGATGTGVVEVYTIVKIWRVA